MIHLCAHCELGRTRVSFPPQYSAFPQTLGVHWPSRGCPGQPTPYMAGGRDGLRQGQAPAPLRTNREDDLFTLPVGAAYGGWVWALVGAACLGVPARGTGAWLNVCPRSQLVWRADTNSHSKPEASAGLRLLLAQKLTCPHPRACQAVM